MTTIPPLAPAVIADLERLARTELSIRARLAHVLLALVASAMTIVVTSLWLTEPALPLRTTVAFAILAGIGLGWVAFSIWVLSARRVMLARHRVVAGRLAVTFTGVFVAGCMLLAFTSSTRAVWPASAMGMALLIVAFVLWRRAEATYARLLTRREALERELDRRTR
jgi:hypothetical protein